jgi:TolB-like protein/tetratricopeptide (TPR) repeat protein
MSFFSELKRRNVFRVGFAYVVAAWLILQVFDVISEILELPAWGGKLILTMLVIGFLIALIVAWAYELTPEGVKRQPEVDRSISIGASTGQKLNITIIVLMTIAISYLLFDKFYLSPRLVDPARPEATAPETRRAESPAITSDLGSIDTSSIAVLPFVDLSQEGDQAWFAHGLAEEIINVLVRVPDLRVAARTSSFRYRDSEMTVKEIGKELGVANILEGSVRFAADRIRVTVQMIRTDDGFHVWSDNYDRESAKIISIQEDLANSIARVLQTSIDPEKLSEMSRVGTDSAPAYQQYLMGLRGTQGSTSFIDERERFKDAYRHFERARELDPNFFSAHVAAANFWKTQLSSNVTMAGITELRPAEMLTRYQERLSAALQSARNDADRLLVMAELAEINLSFTKAIDLYEKYLEKRPNDDLTRWAAIYTAVRAGRIARGRTLVEAWLNPGLNDYEAAIRFFSSGYLVMEPSIAAEHVMRALQNWPNDPSLLYQAQRTLLWAGRNEEASELLARYRVVSSDRTPALLEMRDACARGDRKTAERIYGDIDADEPNFITVYWLMSEMLGYEQAIAETLKPLETNGIPYQLASLLAYKQFDPRPFPGLMAILEREGIDRPPATRSPFACPPAATEVS